MKKHNALNTDIEAITLDLDDTLWPVAPTIAGAEQDLFDWLCACLLYTSPSPRD